MPKTHKNLYSQLLNFELMHESWLKAQKGKRMKSAVLFFERRLECNLFQLIDDLRGVTYRTGDYRSFYVYEPKKREVSCLQDFRDRVLQHAVCSVIEPVFESVFIADSYACRKGKGTHAGMHRAQRMIRAVSRESAKVFALKCDVLKYFANIDHDVLISVLKKKIGDRAMTGLLEDIVRSFGSNNKGLPLGNLTSQLFANIYLNELDQLIKRDFGEKYYIRYMDDFIIFHHDKLHLQQLRIKIEAWLAQNLQLKLNAKTSMFPVSSSKGRPVDFLGYRILKNSRRLRPAAIKSLRKKMRKLHIAYAAGNIGFPEIKQGLASHLAHANHSNSHALLAAIFDEPFKREINSAKDLYNI